LTHAANSVVAMQGQTSAVTPGEIAARLDRLPPSRTIWRIVLLISLGGVFEFYDLFFTAYVAPGMVGTGLFTAQSLGPFAALQAIRVAGFGTFVFCTFAGLWFGVVAFGHAADRFGRKAAFTWSLLWYVGCTLIMALQRSGEWLNVWRFVAGIGFGVQLVTIDTYLVELVPRAQRGRAFSINQFVQFCAVPVVALLAWLLVPLRPWGIDGWRWVVLAGSAGAVAVWGLRAGIPESPRWLAGQGRLGEADAILRRLEGHVSAEPAECLPPPAPAPAPAPAPPEAPERGGATLAEIFSPAYRGRTVMLSVFNVAQVIGFYGFNSWVPTLLIARGINVTHGLEYAFVIAIAQPVGPLLGSLFADRCERKTQIVVGLASMGAAMAAFARASAPPLLILLGILFTLAANVMSYAYHGYQAELFPTHIRARAVGFVYSWSRLAAAFSGLIVGALLGTAGVTAVAAFIGAAMIVGIVAIGVFGPATSGRSLEELNHDNRTRPRA
jgi:putative MFS transporter